jgi:predicted O-methyltransferase YrrM
MPHALPTLDSCFQEIRRAIDGVDGWLSDREAHFLAVLAARPTCSGSILELGSYRGRSTIALAKAVTLGDGAAIHTVDILPPEALLQNLEGAGVRDRVIVHHQPSSEFLAAWPHSSPWRLVWNDGANKYEDVARDVEQILPLLADRAIVAFHDVLNLSGERMLVFADRILDNSHFAAAGVCGSIGWAQFRKATADAAAHQAENHRLRRNLLRLRPFHERSALTWPQRTHYRLLRSLIPHGRVNSETWRRRVA